MPFPILAVPLLVAAASTGGGASVGTIVGAAFGGVAGGALLGGGGYWWYSRNKNKKPPSEEHQDSLNKQAQITRERVEKTKESIESVPPKLNKVAESVQQATQITKEAGNQLKDAAIKLQETGTALLDATKMAKEVIDNLDSASTERLFNQVQENLSNFNVLAGSLTSKEDGLEQATGNIRILQNALDAQIKLGEQLNSILKMVSEKSEEHKETIAQQKTKIETLETEIKQLAVQMRFFKQVTLQNQVPNPPATTQLSGTTH